MSLETEGHPEHTRITCPVCQADYSNLDDPEDYKRVQESQVNQTLKSTVAKIDEFEEACNKAEFTDTGDVWDILYRIRDDCKAALGIETPSTGQQVCKLLQGLGFQCSWECQPGFISVALVDGSSWNFGQANSTWSGDLVDECDQAVDHFLSELPSDCDDANRVTATLFSFLRNWNCSRPGQKTKTPDHPPKCKTCNGTGRVAMPPAYPRFHTFYNECPDCSKKEANHGT